MRNQLKRPAETKAERKATEPSKYLWGKKVSRKPLNSNMRDDGFEKQKTDL